MTEQLTHELRESADGDRTRTERLDEAECWALLARAHVGRVGVIVDGAAEIFPVNYVIDPLPSAAPTIVFRTDPGTKLAGLAGTPNVSFEVDELDPATRTGWSVVVKGRAKQMRQLADPDERHRVEQLPLRHWYAGPKRHSIRIVPAEVTGRRIERSHDRPDGLPTVGEWVHREVWVPPRAGAGTR
jgi:nitroimidazol reductase NimA-like FMN-containing flavoprotein (pyridoxamine 5'-phosphate oxidase superfamily)